MYSWFTSNNKTKSSLQFKQIDENKEDHINKLFGYYTMATKKRQICIEDFIREIGNLDLHDIGYVIDIADNETYHKLGDNKDLHVVLVYECGGIVDLRCKAVDSRKYIKLKEDEIKLIPITIMNILSSFINDVPIDNFTPTSLVRFRTGYNPINGDNIIISPMMIINITNDFVNLACVTSKNTTIEFTCHKYLLCPYDS